MRTLLISSAALVLLVSGGCASVDRARADAHHENAKELAKHGHLIKAAREEHRSNEAEDDARHDPLP